MIQWISLLRGINVGGNNILPMKDLRSLLEGLGLSGVQTYIQSGNCAFQSAQTNAAIISSNIRKAISAQFGFEPKIITLRRVQLEVALAANPYNNPELNPSRVHFFFLESRAIDADLEALDGLKAATEQYHLTDSVFYLNTPEGIGRSKLAARAEAKLGVSATARNLRTVLKLLDMTKPL